MAKPEPEDRGVLRVAAGVLDYSVGGERVWSVPVGEIRLIGEHTTDHGPWVDDYFLAFAAGDPVTVYTASMYAAEPALMEELSRELEGCVEYGLMGRTVFASRVMWPAELVDRPLKRHDGVKRDPGLVNRFKDWLVPLVSEELTDEVQRFLGVLGVPYREL